MTNEELLEITGGIQLYWAIGDMPTNGNWLYVRAESNDTAFDNSAPRWLTDILKAHFHAFEDAEHVYKFENLKYKELFENAAIKEE